MAAKAKAAAAIAGLAVLLVGGLAMASGKKKQKNKTAPQSSEASEEDIEIITPGPDGTPGEGPTILVSADELEITEEEDGAPQGRPLPSDASRPALEVLPEQEVTIEPPSAAVRPITHPMDTKLAVEADKQGMTPEEGIAEVVDTITQGATATPLAAAETSPEMDPDGTVALARLMLARESMPNWKADRMGGDIKEWQQGVGAKPDGMFGIKSAARMAEEVGILPMVRYWPKSTNSKKAAEKLYDSAIAVVIDKLKTDLPDSEAHIAALTASMNREKAVSYGTKNPPAQNTIAFAQDVSAGIAEASEVKGERELNS